MECKEEACSRDAESGHRGWCGGHYARWRTGRPVAGPILDRTRAGRICSEEGCSEPGTRSTRRRAFCESHYAADWRARQPQCSEPDCEKPVSSRGLCGMHYARSIRLGDDRPRCSLEGCEKPLISQAYCNMHYQRWMQTGDPGEAAPRKAIYTPADRCLVTGCPRQAQSKGYCNTHRRRLARFGLTPGELDRLLQRQHGRCGICPARKPGTSSGEWCIDHDHVTGQVRGLLCGRCNSGIGMLQDDPKIIAAAAQYVTRHRQMELFQRKAG